MLGSVFLGFLFTLEILFKMFLFFHTCIQSVLYFDHVHSYFLSLTLEPCPQYVPLPTLCPLFCDPLNVVSAAPLVIL